MSPEKSPQRALKTFGIDESASLEALIWTQNNLGSSEMLKTKMNKLENSNGDIYSFISNMGSLRKTFQFENDTNIEQAYWNGAFYLLSALDFQSQPTNKAITTPSQSTMKTHFFNLIDVENNHGALICCSNEIFEDEKDFNQTLSHFFEGYHHANFDELGKIIAINSQQNVHELFKQNPLLKELLIQGGLKLTHGPVLGLVYGAYDIHELFRLHEESNGLDKRWEINLK